MNSMRTLALALLASCLVVSANAQTAGAGQLKVSSPNGQITFLLYDTTMPPADGAQSAHGVPAGLRYAVEFHGKQLLTESALGMEIVGQPALGPGMHFTGAETSSADDTYTIPVGKTKTVRDHYNGLHAEFEDASGRRLAIEVRVFNDGIGFRYVVPQQPALGQVRIA
jgi:alpha-glucosidase